MPRRSILTARQRAALIDLPKDEASILYHYTLSDHDIEIIRTRRHARNRLGFALQLCAFRYPGRLLVSGEVIPEAVSRFIAAQLGEEMKELSRYAETDVTRRRHLVDLRQTYGFTQNIPATVSEAPYILDGLLMNEAGRKITEQYADTGGFTDHVFAVTSLLGFRFIPRIRDLPSRRLYLFDPASAPNELRSLIGGKIREGLVVQNWPAVLRSAATMVTGVMPPSQLLKKFAAYPRQHELAVALREIGRVERTLFIIEWLLDADMQRRAQIGLNKGEAHHALKNALRIGRQGEIRDRTAEGQHYRMAGLNLLTAIIIYWNTKHLGQAVAARQRAGLNCDPALLAHISPLGWAHILLTGEYRWRRQVGARL